MSIVENELPISSTPRFVPLPLSGNELHDDAPIVRNSLEAGETPVEIDEALIIDDRSGMRPARMVENKLSKMLKDSSIPVSHLQMRGLLRVR
jgi:hypothetical protein